MMKKNISELITGNLGPDKKEQIISGIVNDPEAVSFYKKAKTGWALMSSTRKAPALKIEQSYRQLQPRLNTPPTLTISRAMRYAAILVLSIGLSGIMFYVGKRTVNTENQLKYTSIVADFGQISKVVLPDSSVVWLNSGTTLTYNSDFSFSNRDLNLSGQAFLEVRKNRKLPLVVSSGDLKVKVHGTKFDVSAYPEENKISVALESGSIELLHVSNKKFSYILKPGEMAEYNKESVSLAINESGTKTCPDWKDGVLRFRDTPMAEVIRMLERKFNIEITVGNPAVYKSVFNAKFKNETLTEILDYIQFSCPVSYRVVKENESEKIMLY